MRIGYRPVLHGIRGPEMLLAAGELAEATILAESCCSKSFTSMVKDELIETYDRMRSRYRMS